MIDAAEKMRAVELIGERHEFAQYFITNAVRRIGVVFAGGFPNQLHACDQQERAQNSRQPFKAVDQFNSSRDESNAQYDRANDAPKKHAVLQSSGNGEMFEDDHKHKQVVNAEGKFNDVTGQPLQTDLRGGAIWRNRAVFFYKLATRQYAGICVEPIFAKPPKK